MAKLEGAAASNRYFENEKVREAIRNDIYQEALNADAEGREINIALTEELSSVYESIPYTYAEQGYNQKYVQLLKEKYKFETGKEFKGAGDEIKHLIDEDFADWNFVMNNLSLGMGSELLQNLAFATDEERANALERWNIFNATPNFDSPDVDDSRPFIELKYAGEVDPNDEAAVQRAKDLGQFTFFGNEVGGFELTGQLGDFIKGAGTDPLAWLMFGTGAGFMGKKLIEKGVKEWLAPYAAVATAGAGYSGIHDIGRQAVGITAGSGEQYDPGQTLKSMGLGFAVTPALSAVGSVVGPVGRAVTHPIQSLNKGIALFAGSKSEMAAAQGAIKNVQDKMGQTASGKGTLESAKEVQGFLSQGYNQVDNYFTAMFDKLRTAPIKLSSIDGLAEKWNMRFGRNFELSESWNDLYANYLRGEAAKGNPQLNVKQVPLIDLARKLRSEFYNLSLLDKKNFGGNNTQLMNQYKNTINNVIKKAVKKADPKKGRLLDQSYKLFKSQTEKNPYGKDMLAMAYAETTEPMTKFLNKMLDPQFSWTNFNAAIKHFEKLDHIVGNKSSQLSTGLRTKIEKAMANHILEAPDGAKIFTNLTRTADGRTTLRKMFPSMKKEIDDVIYMQENLKGWGGAESVIGNMATANMGAMAGKSIGGEAGGILGGILSITQWNRLMNSQYFKDAMVHAYKNKGGTLETSTRNWLRTQYGTGNGKKGLSIPQINAIQDTMWGFMFAGYALKGEDVLAERTGNKARDMYGDAKVMFGL
jgi:hypothetical protein